MIGRGLLWQLFNISSWVNEGLHVDYQILNTVSMGPIISTDYEACQDYHTQKTKPISIRTISAAASLSRAQKHRPLSAMSAIVQEIHA